MTSLPFLYCPPEGDPGEGLHIGDLHIVEDKRHGNCKPVDQYRKLSKISDGRFSVLYKAFDTKYGTALVEKEDNTFALKRYKLREHLNDDAVTRVINELSILNQLKHINLVNYHEMISGRKLTSMYLVLDYCEYALCHLFDHDLLLLPEVVKKIMKDLFKGLGYLHSHNFTHGNLSCKKILFNSRGILKIADFSSPFTEHDNLTYSRENNESGAASSSSLAVQEMIPVDKQFPHGSGKQESAPLVKQEPTPFVKQEPTPFVKQETIPFVKQETIPFIEQEPTPLVKQEPTPVVKPEPTSDSENDDGGAACAHPETISSQDFSYKAPEILLGSKKVDPSMDMWSVGCIFAEMLQKRRLFPGESEKVVFAKIVDLLGYPSEDRMPGASNLLTKRGLVIKGGKRASYLAAKFKEKDPGCVNLLHCLLHYNPEKRFKSQKLTRHFYFKESPRAIDSEGLCKVLAAAKPNSPEVSD